MNQPPPVPPPSRGPNPYDFISNPAQPPKKSMLPAGNSIVGRAIIAGAGLVLLIIIAVIINSLLSSSSRELKQDFLTAAQQQTELIRISEIGIRDAQSDQAKDMAVTANLVITSDYNQLLELAASSKITLDKRQLGLAKNTRTDELLEQAKQIGQFDQVFTENMQTQLAAYQSTLKRIFEASKKDASKQLLSDMFENAGLIHGSQSSDGAWLSLPATKS